MKRVKALFPAAALRPDFFHMGAAGTARAPEKND